MFQEYVGTFRKTHIINQNYGNLFRSGFCSSKKEPLIHLDFTKIGIEPLKVDDPDFLEKSLSYLYRQSFHYLFLV